MKIGLVLVGLCLAQGQSLMPSEQGYFLEAAPEQGSDKQGSKKRRPADIASVAHMQAYGRCVAQRQPAKAAAILGMDFTKPEYRRALKKLAISEASCLKGSSRAEFAGVLFAGALAEQLLTRTNDLGAALVYDPGKKPGNDI